MKRFMRARARRQFTAAAAETTWLILPTIRTARLPSLFSARKTAHIILSAVSSSSPTITARLQTLSKSARRTATAFPTSLFATIPTFQSKSATAQALLPRLQLSKMRLGKTSKSAIKSRRSIQLCSPTTATRTSLLRRAKMPR